MRLITKIGFAVALSIAAINANAQHIPSADNYEHIDIFKTDFVHAVDQHLSGRTKDILIKRERLEEIISRGVETMPVSDKEFVSNTEKSFDAYPDDFDELLNRVDILPKGLMVALFIYESRWGTEDHYLERNNPFGIKDKKGVYQHYDSIDNAIRDFLHIVNTERAFRRFRDDRSMARKKGLVLEAQDYIKHFVDKDEIPSVLRIISQERLYYLD